jgi:hypothetical protein
MYRWNPHLSYLDSRLPAFILSYEGTERQIVIHHFDIAPEEAVNGSKLRIPYFLGAQQLWVWA